MSASNIPAALARGIADGWSVHKIVHRPKSGPDGLSCWIALPNQVSPSATPIVAVHGIRRNAREQAELFAARAAAMGRPVIAPLFEAERWPRYQQTVRRGRADLALWSLMVGLRQEGLWQTSQFDLFGYSGGAQFAHRFAMLHPHLIARLTTASAGWYTFPDAARFPYGLTPRTGRPDPWSSVAGKTMRRFLALPIQVCVGADDNVRDDNTRSGPAIDAQQGTHRLARAIRWTRALRAAARDAGIEPSISFNPLSACGHDFHQCATRGGLDRIVVPDGAAPRHSGPAPSAQPCQAMFTEAAP